MWSPRRLASACRGRTCAFSSLAAQSKQIIAVGNGPGQEVDDVVEALKLVREGRAINFQGAGSTCDFTPNGDQLGRGMGQWINKGGKSVFVSYEKP
jgi:ABC-type branched-subunit amino acid transport system substrate-binding protein